MMKHPGGKGAAWAVQVYVYERGDARRIGLIALGKSTGKAWLFGNVGSYHMGFSKDHRDELARLLS